MFPQSELDNYKLQVELLQEKLQRSEISRQQLEHKLDKILQKRDEHDKLMRSKAKQKYQQFLEEQQRRNERNKQLIQMLERIEQQTEAMNARSERLKMMKLQYEMYFAKMVHSQTRRCIQNSVSPITQMMPTTSHHYVTPQQQNLKQNIEPSPVMEGYNYANNVDALPPKLMVNSYQQYVATNPKIANEQLLRTSAENIPLEMPTLANFARANRSDYGNLKNPSVAPTTTTQQPYQYQANYEIINNEIIPNSSHFNRQEMPGNSISSPTINTSDMSLSSVTNLLPKNKQLADIRETSNLSTPISSTFDETSNVNMIPQNMNKVEDIQTTTTTITNMQQDRNNNAKQLGGYIQPAQVETQNVNQIPLASINQKPEVIKQKENIINTLPQDIRSDIKNPIVKAVKEVKPEVKPEEATKPVDNAMTPLEMEPTKSDIKTTTTYMKNQVEPIEQINTNTSATLSNTETDTSAAPVSIENIENAIYGELLSPLETEEVQKPENSIVAPKLLENLVTEPENLETEISPLEDSTLKAHIVPDNNIMNNSETTEVVEQTPEIQNYEQTTTYDDYNNVQQSNDNTNNEYPNYENGEGTNLDESQQQQQEYDYSNYDPTQYSYPGYIYDETTGEYKPDPNASAEQYATDQQYSTEAYDQQQYQQQDVYDYNQTYEQEPNTSTVNVDNTDYNNYEIAQEDNTSNNLQDNNIQPQETIAEPETIQSEIKPEEIPQPSTKITKPTSILSSADKNDSQKKKKRVNFVDSSETDESAVADKVPISNNKTPAIGNVNASGESDFDFSSSTEGETKITT